MLPALLSDADLSPLFTAEAEIRSLLDVEAAFARALAVTGRISTAAAEHVSAAAASLDVDAGAIAAATDANGVPVAAIVDALQAAAGDYADCVHQGLTSQDVVDTAFVLRAKKSLEIIDRRLDALVERLAALAQEHRSTPMPARTRSQQATPTTFGLKAAGWLMPLVRCRKRLAELRPRLLVLSLGGSAGTLTAWGEDAEVLERALAEALGLDVPAVPWHAQRDSMAELGSMLSLVTGTLGKVGADLILMAQTEVGEVRFDDAAGSSTAMPQKRNPVPAENLVALARFNAGLLGPLHESLVHVHERDGSAWQLEWLTLPQMILGAGRALSDSDRLLKSLMPDPRRMRANLDASKGLIMAEAATRALAAHFGFASAKEIVRCACDKSESSGGDLLNILAQQTDAPVDWEGLRQPDDYVKTAERLVARALKAAGH